MIYTGLVEVCLMHPLDLVKTRLQVGQHDKGMLDCMFKTFRAEGISGFYKGILPPILAETPKRATKFFTFEQYRQVFSHPDISPAIQKSTATMAREIISKEGMGLNGIYRGLTATLGRHGAWNMVYFGLYHNMKVFIPDVSVSAFGMTFLMIIESPNQNLIGRIVLGFTAGSLASIFNIPFDVVKSRIQGPQPSPLVRKYNGAFQSINLIYREEGLRTLYKGLLPKIMRLGPGGAIMLIVYENVYEWLKKNS
uniref:Mitochondrial 2-oxodicarboxylate carrier n=1 Tax=Heterorhabditis bacteriophora TaxID=37862 RepID=A0A1I7XRC6_HETBA